MQEFWNLTEKTIIVVAIAILLACSAIAPAFACIGADSNSNVKTDGATAEISWCGPPHSPEPEAEHADPVLIAGGVLGGTHIAAAVVGVCAAITVGRQGNYNRR